MKHGFDVFSMVCSLPARAWGVRCSGGARAVGRQPFRHRPGAALLLKGTKLPLGSSSYRIGARRACRGEGDT